MYVYQEYPKWKYHPDKEPLIVPDADSENALGSDWYDSPAEATQALEAVREAVRQRKVPK
jgi:hypothetical protein